MPCDLRVEPTAEELAAHQAEDKRLTSKALRHIGRTVKVEKPKKWSL
jgi:hypothetical protein